MVSTSGATTRGNSSATARIEVVAGKKRTQFDFCHCQNLTVLARARLNLVHPTGPIQRASLVSWWKKVEHCTQSRTHAMMQTKDYRFDFSAVHVEDNPLHVDRNAKKKLDPIPTAMKKLNSFKTVFEKPTLTQQ